MNVGFVSTRLTGTDGVSLETDKLVRILSRLGHTSFYCAGELSPSGPPGALVPEMSFHHPEVQRIQEDAFGDGIPSHLLRRITALAQRIRRDLEVFVEDCEIDLLITQNALAIPMNLCLGMALTDFIAESQIPTFAHHHDLWWERDRFAACRVPDILLRCFPPTLPSIRHVVINRLAQKALADRLGLGAFLLPNVLDFETGPPPRASRRAALRKALGLDLKDRLFVQPTRVVARKGIEHSIELVRRLQRGEPHRKYTLLITHSSGDEGDAYLQHLQQLATDAQVDLQHRADWFADLECASPEDACGWTLRDSYEASDFVTYPSLIEGFGNAFLEAVFYRRPILVNRYPVYVSDIAPHGFHAVEIQSAITDEAVARVQLCLENERLAYLMTDANYETARRHFSFEAAERIIERVLDTYV